MEKTSDRLLELIEQNPRITMKTLAERLDMSRRGIESHIKSLKEKGLLERICPDRFGYWEIIGKR